MKIKALLILILTFCLLFTGCNQEQVEATVPPTTQPTEPPAPKVGIVLRNQAQDEADAQALQQLLEQQEYEILIRDSENDQAKQNEQVKTLLDNGCQVLIVQPVMTSGLDVLVDQVKPTGVPLIILDHKPEDAVLDSYDKLVFLGADHSQAAKALSEVYAQLPISGDLNFDGNTWLVMVTGPEDHLDSKARQEGFTTGNEEHLLLEAVSAEWSREGGRSATAQLLAKYGPDIEVIVTLDGEMALGALEAINNGGRDVGRDLYLVTVGGSTETHTEAEAGRISGLAAPDQQSRLSKLEELVGALIAGEAAEKINYIDYVTQLNLLT